MKKDPAAQLLPNCKLQQKANEVPLVTCERASVEAPHVPRERGHTDAAAQNADRYTMPDKIANGSQAMEMPP